MVHGLYWLVANLAAAAPVALLVDDAQWADTLSLRFLAYLARRLDELAAVLVVSVRTGEVASDPALIAQLREAAGRGVMSPPQLSEGGVASMLATQFDRAPDPQFVRACHEATGGNPFFVRELAAALIADGIEPADDAAARIAAAAPATIARTTLARLGRLSPDAADLARAIAVLGPDARLPRAASLAGLDERRALHALDALGAADVVSSAGAIEFRHPIVHAAIYDDLAPGARSLAHRRAAALLHAEGEDPGLVAGHLLRSAPVGSGETVAILRDAARHALVLGAPETAADYLSRALAEGLARELRAAVLFELALAEKLARRPSALEHFAEVRRLAEDPTLRARAGVESAELLWYSGEWEQGMALLDAALVEFGDRGDDVVIVAETLRAEFSSFVPRLSGDLAARLPRLYALAARGGPRTRPLACGLAGPAAMRDEPSDQVRALVERGWDGGGYLRDGESPTMLAVGISALIMLDDLDRAGELIAATRAFASASGSVVHYLIADGHDAWLQAHRGDLAAGAALMRATVERALEIQEMYPVLVTFGYCGELLLERPDLDDLAAMVETAQPGVMSEALVTALWQIVRGRLRFEAGRRAEAIADLRAAGAMCEALQMTNACGCQSWRSWLALMLDEAGRSDALALVRTELEQAQRVGHARRVGVALRSLGTLQAGEHRGLRMLEQAVGVLAASPARPGARPRARRPRRGAATAGRARSRSRPAARGARPGQPLRRGAPGRARPRRAGGGGSAAASPAHDGPRCADAERAARRADGGPGAHEPGDRAGAVRHHADDRHASQPRLRQAGDRLAPKRIAAALAGEGAQPSAHTIEIGANR